MTASATATPKQLYIDLVMGVDRTLPDPDLSPKARLVCVAVASRCFGPKITSHPGRTLLAAMTGLSPSTVSRALTEAVEAGWLRLAVQGGAQHGEVRSASVYELAVPPSHHGHPDHGHTDHGQGDARPWSQRPPTLVRVTTQSRKESRNESRAADTCFECLGCRHIINEAGEAMPCPTCAVVA